MVRPTHALVAMLAAAALAGAVVACADDEGSRDRADGAATREPAPTRIVGGATRLRLDDRLEDVLGLAGLELAPTAPATAGGGALVFPIDRGELDVDPPSGRLEHRGGLRFGPPGGGVEATDLVLDAGRGELTAAIAGRRIPLMAVDLGRPRVPDTGDAVVWPGSAGLSPEAAALINDRLGVEVLRGGLSLGRITVAAERP